MSQPTIVAKKTALIKNSFFFSSFKAPYKSAASMENTKTLNVVNPKIPVSAISSPHMVCAGTLVFRAAGSRPKKVGAIFVLLKCSKKDPYPPPIKGYFSKICTVPVISMKWESKESMR